MTVSDEFSGRERRQHTRFKINLRESVEIEGQATPVMDISWGGIGLISSVPYPEGSPLDFFKGGLVVSARVLECTPVENSASGSGEAYRVRCQFVEDPEHMDIKALMNIVWAEEFGKG